jgi:hypothetical protein
MDPGRFTYDEQEPNLRHWFKGTAAHNTVVVDGLDQTPYRRGKPRKGTIARGRLVARHGAPCLDVVEGEATSTCYDAVHRRRVTFVADDYWVVEDRLAAPTPHRYDLRFHLAPEANGHVEVTAREDGFVVRAPGMALVVAGGVEPRVEAGWIAPDYGIRHEAPVVSIVPDGACDATFTTLVVPLRDDEEPLEIDGAEVTDTICWSDEGTPLDLGPLKCRAAAGLIRRDAEGPALVRAVGVGGGPVWAGWDRDRGMSAGREGEL